MKNVIVVSFTEEAKAIEALHKLNELESYGDITIYEHVMVRKNANGRIEILKQNDTEGWRALTGMGVGSLLGLLGGPVGFLIGLYTGAAIGVISDASHYDFADDFVAKVEKKIAVGTVTIIAEIEEDSKVFVDSYLLPMGATISRSDFDLEFANHVDEKIDGIEADIAEERAALKQAVGNDKKKIQNKIAELQEKRSARIAELTAKGKQAEETVKAKAVSGIAKVKADFQTFESNISEEVRKEKLARIKRRIDRHEDTLNELNSQLKELQV